jgi:hypothetical protein
MEWGGNAQVGQGTGEGQEDAARKAESELIRGTNTQLEIPVLTDVPASFTKLQVALSNLSQVPPARYSEPGMVESFLLAAGTALARFEDLPIEVLGRNLLVSERQKLVAALQTEGDVSVDGPFFVTASYGCLNVDSPDYKVRVFVKTPFAHPNKC